MIKKILFRVPVTNKTGIGHFMRSLSLALALKNNSKYHIKFVINNNNFAKKLLKKNKIIFKVSKYLYPQNLDDAKFLNENNIDLVIVDSPILKNQWIEYFKKKEIKTLGIFSDTKSFKPTNYELWPESNLNQITYKKKMSLKFSLLSNEYWKKFKPKKSKSIKKILITFGGCDHLDLTSKYLNALNKFVKRRLNIIIIIGQFYNNIKKIKLAKKLSNHKITLINKPFGIFDYIKDCELVINAGGTTLIEACILKKKTITTSVWTSQDNLTRNILHKKNFIICNKVKNLKLQSNINKKITEMIIKNKKCQYLKKIDGYGCKRASIWIKKIVSN